MENFERTQRAHRTYAVLCSVLDSMGWRYDRDDSDLSVRTGATGDDIPIDILISIDADKQLATVFSPLSFEIPEDMRIEVALSLTAINNRLVNGCFDYDVTTGTTVFRLASCFEGSELSEDVFRYMILCTCKTVDEYNDKIFMIIKKAISVDELVEYLNRRK